MSIAEEKYVSFTTFRRSGERKSTPVWIVPIDGGAGFTTGRDSWKMKRLRSDPRCELQPSNGRGVVVDGTVVVTGTARESTPEEYQRIAAAVTDKYGVAAKLIRSMAAVRRFISRSGPDDSTGVIVTLD
ncbi:MAG: PPOX class F420-dependent oxidoreductase [Actinomycetota bacterium]